MHSNMFVKILGSLLLLGLFCFQLSSSLDCRSCDSPQSCKSAGKITCNRDNANTTTKHLMLHYVENVSNITSTNFDCFYHNLTSVSYNVTYKGCMYRPIKACSLTLRNASLKKQDCKQCSGNMCNPAGTFSSSLMTVLASIVVVAVYKVLNV